MGSSVKETMILKPHKQDLDNFLNANDMIKWFKLTNLPA